LHIWQKKTVKFFFGKPISPKQKLYTSSEKKLSQFIDNSKPLAGLAGLKELTKKGYLRASTKEDINKWAKFQEKIHKKDKIQIYQK